MNNLIKDFRTISINNSVDNLCDILENSNIEYDEYKELKNDTYDNLNVTIERYHRYIKYINTWEIYDIHDLILEYLSQNIKCKSLSRQIDNELLKIIDTDTDTDN